jgi:hypothetical protein
MRPLILIGRSAVAACSAGVPVTLALPTSGERRSARKP